MRFVWTIIWALLLSLIISYVLTSMAGQALSLAPIFALTAIFSIAVIIIGDGILGDSKKV
ncbi:DUF2929 family protein [Aquibacillus sediminis]|uniref:DUF2929 family protein n=1 Tax=Aquibacillus sediminis TaxID=2574734 RepID=UPI0011097B62|nr:DUF2929 family protein [Aquibacillus sediminis]